MWSPTSRRQHSRAALRYGSDLTDAEWAILEPLLPPPCACGRKRKWPMRRIVEAILFIMRAGCAWDMLPDGFPPFLTVYRWFARFRDDGTWERINHHLVMQDRERVGRAPSPSAAVIDSQSAKTAEAGGPRGYDAGKKVNGRKRHALVDTDGRLIKLIVHPADIQDRDGGAALLKASRRSFPFVELVLPTPPTPASAWRMRLASPFSSCASPMTRSGSRSTSGAGSWSASSPGSAATAASCVTSSA
jgi:transposase